MKKCSGCSIEKPNEEFSKNKRKADGLQTRCKSCSSVANKDTYARLPHRRAAIRERNKKTREATYSFILRYKRFCGCKVCGEKEPIVLDLHHVNMDDKDTEVSKLVGFSMSRIRSEIKKCVVLCSNCHRKVHAGILLV